MFFFVFVNIKNHFRILLTLIESFFFAWFTLRYVHYGDRYARNEVFDKVLSPFVAGQPSDRRNRSEQIFFGSAWWAGAQQFLVPCGIWVNCYMCSKCDKKETDSIKAHERDNGVIIAGVLFVFFTKKKQIFPPAGIIS